MFCCESGTHVVDPAQSYYLGIHYRAGNGYLNLSTTDSAPRRDPDAPCLDSSQAHFCRDLWVNAAREGVREVEKGIGNEKFVWAPSDFANEGGDDLRAVKRSRFRKRADDGLHAQRQRLKADADANVGSDYDAMPDSDSDALVDDEPLPAELSIPNSVFRPARILINPRCVTTYAGVRHAELALDLFGPEKDEVEPGLRAKYILDDWEGAPESFVCQEQK